MLRILWLLFAIIIIPFNLFYWRSNKTKLVFYPLLGDDVLVIKFLGHFLHNNASEIEVFTDGRQNDVDLADISLTWHLKGIKIYVNKSVPDRLHKTVKSLNVVDSVKRSGVNFSIIN